MLTKGLTNFTNLTNIVGTAGAQAVQNMLFERYQNAGTITVRADQVATYPGTVDQMFAAEVNQINGKIGYVGTLLGQARNGTLRGQLAIMTRPVNTYFVGTTSTTWAAHVTSQLDATGGAAPTLDPNIEKDKAYSWITDSWTGPGMDRVQTELDNALNAPAGGPPLGPNASMLQAIFQPVVANLASADNPMPPYRGPNFATSYPSSVGGNYLLNWIFTQTAATAWPPQGDDQWEDWALFYLGSIVTVQGFTDGNKRMGRLAYSIVLLKAGREFKAPTVALENQLYHM
jgi:hypothetical protein